MTEPVEVRAGRAEDVAPLVALSETVAEPSMDWAGALARDLGAEDRHLLVAATGDGPVGYARVGWYAPSAPPRDGDLEPGYLLAGLVVDPGWRRRGIGAALVRAAGAWVAERDVVLWSFTEVGNVASLALHERLGFVPVTRRFRFPGLAGDGSHVLLRSEVAP